MNQYQNKRILNIFWISFSSYVGIIVASDATKSIHLSTKLSDQSSILRLWDDLYNIDSEGECANSPQVRNGAADVISNSSPVVGLDTNMFESSDFNDNTGIPNDIFHHDLQLSTMIHLPHLSSSGIQLNSVKSHEKPTYSKKLLKTGTTIVGCLANNNQAVILAADTRATCDTIVADKGCEKIHCLAPNVWCCGAGTSGDIDALVRQVKYTFLLRNRIDSTVGNQNYDINDYKDRTENNMMNKYKWDRGKTSDIANVQAICTYIQSQLFPSRGEIGANLVLGGYEYTTRQAVLAAIHPHGSIATTIPFTALGSGGLAAMSILESDYEPNLTLDEAKLLAIRAVKAGIDNDLGSGSQVDVCIITNKGVYYQRAIMEEEKLSFTDRDINAVERINQKYSKAIDDDVSNDIIMSGVNGFGSLPYRVRSKKVIIQNENIIEKERRDWIRSKLGLRDD